MFYLIKSINSHPHFTVNYFAADGETSLNSFHELAFNEYKDQIDKVINSEITFESFFEYVKTNCIILPLLDMFHAEKGCCNRIINNDINLGSSEDLIKLDIIKNSLEIHGGVFEDKSTIGRMKDAYPIYLFQLKNSLKEFKEGHNASGFYIFIYSLILEIFRNNKYVWFTEKKDIMRQDFIYLYFQVTHLNLYTKEVKHKVRFLINLNEFVCQ